MADIQTYSGIVNENEFFSHHYFSSEFQNNIKDLLYEWNSRETEEEGFKSPVNLLKNCRKEWFKRYREITEIIESFIRKFTAV